MSQTNRIVEVRRILGSPWKKCVVMRNVSQSVGSPSLQNRCFCFQFLAQADPRHGHTYARIATEACSCLLINKHGQFEVVECRKLPCSGNFQAFPVGLFSPILILLVSPIAFNQLRDHHR